MKKFFKYLIIPMLALAASSCLKEEVIVFDHEQQAFEARAGKILIEAIMPQASTAEEEIYIVGKFNGDSAKAFKNPAYLMERSASIPQKWGIYLDPTTFEPGTTLADGFTFISVDQGWERTSTGKAAVHKIDIKVGDWANVYVDKWAKYFEKGSGEDEKLPEHEGVRIYVVDETGWDAIALYQWGDVNDYGGSWPGAQVTGTMKVFGKEYKYFDFGDDIIGLNQNLIFNNNGGGTQLADYALSFDGTKDYFLKVTADGVEAMDTPGGKIVFPEHDGVRVYAINQTGWDAISLYQWGSVNDFGGSWPGAQVSGTLDLGGESYIYFEYGDDIIGLSQNLIFNNNGGGTQLADYAITFDGTVKDYFLMVTADSVTPFDPNGGDTPTPGPDPEPVINPDDYFSLYILDKTGWNDLAVYSWGNDAEENNVEAFGAWPGAVAYSEVVFGEDTYKRFLFAKDAVGTEAHLIFNNNNGGVQFDGPAIILKDELFLNVTVTNEAIEVIDPRATFNVYVQDNSGWDGFALYAWGDGPELFGGWPGAQPVETIVVGGKEWKRFEINSSFNGTAYNFIFNNNGGGVQFDGPNVTLNSDHWFVVSDSSCEEVGAPAFHLYVDDKTGWDAITMYAWGDEECFGSWPGAAPAGTETIDGITYKYFNVGYDKIGLNENLIFNNNGNGSQTPDYNITFSGDAFLKVTPEGVTNPKEGSYSIYVKDNSGWDALAMYAWGDGGIAELFGGWAGATPTQTFYINGEKWYRFAIDQKFNGLSYHLIFNNNGAGAQFDGPFVELSRDYWFTITSSACEETTKPADGFRVCVDDQTGWDAIALYMWGDVNDLHGGWPGMSVAGTQEIGGVTYKYFQFDAADAGLTENLIFNNAGNGSQLADYNICFDGFDVLLNVTAEGVSLK